MNQMQLTCARPDCGSVVHAGDRFCGVCGTPAPSMTRPVQWRETSGAHRAPAPPMAPAGVPAPPREGPFFSHEQLRPPGRLTNATRFLCAAAYLDRPFANQVIRELLATRRAVAPSVGFDVGPVLRHCLRARRISLVRDIALLAIMLLGLLIKTLPTLLFLIFALVIGILTRAGRGRRGTASRLGSVLVILAGVVLAVAVLAVLVLGGFNSLLNRISDPFGSGYSSPYSSYTYSRAPGIASIALPFFLLLAATLVTEFVFLRTTFLRLREDLRSGAESPRAVSAAAEQRIALVEGAQWGNVTLHGTWFPFIGAGLQTEAHWSIAVPLRRKDPAGRLFARQSPNGEPVKLDLVGLHRWIRERLLLLNDPALPVNERMTALSVSDRVVGSGLLRSGNPLLDAELKTPYSHASREAVETLIRHPQARLRYYLQASVSDESPPVMSRGRKVIDGVDQEISVSAFVYAAVEGHMFYLQFVLTALPPINDAYREIEIKYGKSAGGMFALSMKRLFGSVILAPVGIVKAFRLWRTEQRVGKEYMSSAEDDFDFDFSAQVSVRQLGTASDFRSYIEELDAEKYNMMISRLLLESVTEYLDSQDIDTSAFTNRALNIINGDVNYASGNNGQVNQGGRGNTYNL